jgi:hypothetical protein
VVTAPPLAWISIEIAYERQDIALSAHSSIDPHQSRALLPKSINPREILIVSIAT